MEFGICVDTHIDKWDLVRYAEELGYERAWIPDFQMIWSDCYAVMALAAQATQPNQNRHGRLHSGDADCARHRPFDCHYQPYRSRAYLPWHRHRPYRNARDGTGADADQGVSRIPPRDARAAPMARRSNTPIRGRHARDPVPPSGPATSSILNYRVPIYVAANGPKACATTGAFGDGWITAAGCRMKTRAKMTLIKGGRAESL